MESLFRGSKSITRGTTLAWQIRGFLLIALISSQGCAIISKPTDRTLPTKPIPQSEPQAVYPPSDKRPTPALPIEVPPVAKVPSLPPTEQPAAISKIPVPAPPTLRETGLASWYGPQFHGRRTASGEVFNQDKFTAAHPTLPWGSKVKVTNLTNGKSVDVRINDRGPYGKGRIIDVSRAAARALDMVGQGLATVQIELLSDSEKTNDLVLQDK